MGLTWSGWLSGDVNSPEASRQMWCESRMRLFCPSEKSRFLWGEFNSLCCVNMRAAEPSRMDLTARTGGKSSDILWACYTKLVNIINVSYKVWEGRKEGEVLERNKREETMCRSVGLVKTWWRMQKAKHNGVFVRDLNAYKHYALLTSS